MLSHNVLLQPWVFIILFELSLDVANWSRVFWMTCFSSGESISWVLGTATVCSSLSVGTGLSQSIPYPVSYMIEDYLVIPSPQLIKQYIQALHVQQCTCIETNTYVIRCTKSFHTAMVCWKILQTHYPQLVGGSVAFSSKTMETPSMTKAVQLYLDLWKEH